MGVRIDRAAMQNATLKVTTMEKRIKNMNPMWAKVGSYLAQVNKRQFATEGAYLGKPWKPLKPEYRQWKVKNGYGGRKTLVQTGDMRASFVSRPMMIEVYGNHSASFGSGHRLAPFQQYATHRNGKRAIPPRPIIVANKKVARDIAQIVAEYVVNKSSTTVRKYL